MRLPFLLFVTASLLLLLLPISAALDQQFLFCLPFIALLGIPHGAIDHILFSGHHNIRPTYFYLTYILIMALYAIMWVFFPALSLVLFLFLSSFHFGQSQWGVYSAIPGSWRLITGVSWGACILSFLFYCHPDDLSQLHKMADDVAFIQPVLLSHMLPYIAGGTLILFTASFLYCIGNRWLTARQAQWEGIVLVAILAVFNYLPMLLAFTLYFVFLHSCRVMGDEYRLLQRQGKVVSVTGFIALLSPLTLISLVGGGCIAFSSLNGWLPISIPFVAIAGIAVITLPHSGVMHLLYDADEMA